MIHAEVTCSDTLFLPQIGAALLRFDGRAREIPQTALCAMVFTLKWLVCLLPLIFQAKDSPNTMLNKVENEVHEILENSHVANTIK